MFSRTALGAEGLGPAARVNPFSGRDDLKGGKIKLYDSPSRSVISLSFELLPPPPPPSPSAMLAAQPLTPEPLNPARSGLPCGAPPARRCRSLPELRALGGRGQAAPDLSPRQGQRAGVGAGRREGKDHGVAAAGGETEETGVDSRGRSPPAERTEAPPPPRTARAGGRPQRSPETDAALGGQRRRSYSNIPRSAGTVGGARAQHLPGSAPALHVTQPVDVYVTEPKCREADVTAPAPSSLCRPADVTAPVVRTLSQDAPAPMPAAGPLLGSAELRPEQEADERLSCPGCCLGGFAFPFPPVCLRSNSQPARYPDLNCESDRLIGEEEGAAM
ncbi:hypothetical protein chiPu_0027413, partial [Chiloscyllium punctatum]|nr:hypothetical protein [Chiloscyllium punctatum]